jgi:glyoxylase-like metal-dependent hydrolase (beta-lactamase superfamily II)/rhodanese-related sulfurtransferase
MELDVLVTPGLGDNSYLLSWGDEAAVIDPQRDAERFLRAAQQRSAAIGRVIETHVHNDYVSGAAELRAATGAEIWGPADAGFAFGYRATEDGTEIPLGDHTLVALAAPGHTPEHVSYLLRDANGDAVGLFSGGSLIVGSAGRTDLLGQERADELTRLQFRSIRRLATLPDAALLLPTHGAGSFCAVGTTSDERTSTIGAERASNPALADPDEERFVRRQQSGLMAFPRYYAFMAPINRAGPRVTGTVPVPAAMSPGDVASSLADGAWLVDARDGAAFAAEHVPGSVSIPLEDSFAAYVGWLLPFDTPMIVSVLDDDALVEAATQLFRIGRDAVLGHLDGGIDAWRASGRPTSSYPTLSVEELVEELAIDDTGEVLDVRQRTEWDEGHLEGTRHVFVGDLPERIDAFDPATVRTIVCASGYRSSMAASLLDRAGVPVRLVSRSGVPRALRLLARSG